MSSDSSYISLAENLLVLGLRDWVQAYEVVGEIVGSGIPATDDIVPELSFAILDYLLSNELMVAGSVSRDGFRAWPQTPEVALQTIKTEWRKLDDLPSLGDVCWLQNTDHGDKIGQSRSAAPDP